MSRSRQTARESPDHPVKRRSVGSPLLSMLFFPAVILYQELLLRLFDRDVDFFDIALLRVALFSLAAGLCLFLILDLLPWRGAARTAGGAAIGLGAVLFCVERGCRSMFGLYYSLGFMGSMAGDVTGDFGGMVLEVARALTPFILLSLMPLAVYIPLRRTVIREEGQKSTARSLVAAALVFCQLGGYLLSSQGSAKSYYTYEYNANAGIPHFGLITAVRLELEYAVVGTPASPDSYIDDPIYTPAAFTPVGTGEPSVDPTANPSDGPIQTPVPTGPNVLDIDFAALAEAETDETIKGLHQYFASQIPSEKNKYTGILLPL